jgi:ABC-2 type transport system permease protein
MSLLAIEWLKIRRYRTFWVLIIFFMVLLPFWNYQIMNGVIKMGNDRVNILNQAYGFPSVWSNFGWWGSIFVLFLSILVITITCNEYTFRTHRQNVIDGWSRLNFFHAKVALVLALSLATTVFVFTTGGVFGTLVSGSASGLFSDLSDIGYFFLLVLNYLSAALFIALWIRRSGLAISLFLLYALIIEYAISASVNHYTNTKWGNLMPLQSSDELLPFPLMRMAEGMLGRTASLSDYAYVIATICWITIYYFAGRRIVLKRDM